MGEFDVAIIGGGMGGLATAALLSTEGYRIILIERHSELGGYAHSLKLGDFDFCYQVQYLMGCEPGGPVRRFLNRLDLSKEIDFNFLDPYGYDVLVTQGGRRPIPSGLQNFERLTIQEFPDEKKGIRSYFKLMDRIFCEALPYDSIITRRQLMLHPWKHRHLLQNISKTVGQFYDELGLSSELRLWLSAQAGNHGLAPSETSLLMHAGMIGAYSRSAAYPKKGMRHFISSIERRILESGGVILKDQPVTRLETRGSKVTSILAGGKNISAHRFISNLDPLATLKLAGFYKARDLQKYDYSDCVVSLYLGLEGTDLRSYGFGRRNFWFHSEKDIEKEFSSLQQGDPRRPWIFISSPSLLADAGELCREDQTSLIMLTFVDFDFLESLRKESKARVENWCRDLERTFLSVLERHFVPRIHRFIKIKHLETPFDVIEKLGSPKGNVYGARSTPKNWSFSRVTRKSPYMNLSFIGATACYPGVMPILVGAMELADGVLRDPLESVSF